jgi:uncharacterized protein (TIGR03086 family)
MPDDLRTERESPPTDELESAEAAFAVLERILDGIAEDDESKQTPCREFTVAQLTDHLMNSITVIGAAAGAPPAERDPTDSLQGRVVGAARPALDAWHKRGLDGMVPFRSGEAPAKLMAGILSLEFLVRAWDYAKATEIEVTAPDALSEYVLRLAKEIITPEGRSTAGFDNPVDVLADAGAMDRLVAFTGRRPA